MLVSGPIGTRVTGAGASRTEKALRAALRRHDAGAVEILVRGLDVDPNALRRRLRLRGSASVTVVLTRIGRAPTALLCRAERTPSKP